MIGLGAQSLLWLSGALGWAAWHKGYAVLTAVAFVATAFVGLTLWFAVSLPFRWQFQFGTQSLLALVVVLGISCSWLAVEMKSATQQQEAARAVREVEGTVHYDYENEDPYGESWPPPGPAWLRNLVGKDFLLTLLGCN